MRQEAVWNVNLSSGLGIDKQKSESSDLSELTGSARDTARPKAKVVELAGGSLLISSAQMRSLFPFVSS